jgi:hypothetical protein
MNAQVFIKLKLIAIETSEPVAAAAGRVCLQSGGQPTTSDHLVPSDCHHQAVAGLPGAALGLRFFRIFKYPNYNSEPCTCKSKNIVSTTCFCKYNVYIQNRAPEKNECNNYGQFF